MHPTHLPSSTLRAARRRLRRVALPLVVIPALVAGTIAAGAVMAAPAGAAPAVGTFTIGDAPITLNQPTDPGMGRLAPTADAADKGMFGPQVAWPLIPLQVALARNGHLVSYGTPLDSTLQGGLVYDDWDTTAGWERSAHTDTLSMHDYNSFCNALVTLDDGRMLMVGGNSSSMSMVYDPTTHQQTMGADLAQQRWYATTLRLTDGRILVLGGADYYNSTAYLTPDDDSGVATTPEIGSGTGPWTQLTGATSIYAFGARSNRWWYPRAFNGPNGNVVGISNDHLWTLSAQGDGSLQEYGNLTYQPGVSASQVMYAPGKILLAGGGQFSNADEAQAFDTAEVIDVTGSTAVVTPTTPMHFGRNWLNLSVLPTGDVLANGGTKMGTDAGDANSVKQAEVWNPATGQWRLAATAQRTRTYHSVSLVLPSGAVFTGGGGTPGPEDNLNAELYYPSYLFTKGADGSVRWASRPAISAISGSAVYGGRIAMRIADGRTIASASLISSPVVTHAQNTDQRRIPLEITQNGGIVTASLPDSMNTMPAGDYELTVVDSKGVPSAAQMITIKRSGAGLVTVAKTGEPGDPTPSDPGDPTGGSTGEGAPAGTPGTDAGTSAGSPNTGTPGARPGGTVPLTVDRSVGLDSVNKPGYRVQRAGTSVSLAHVRPTSSKAARTATSWAVRRGLASATAVSFESIDRPGYYLAAPQKGSGAVRLVRDDGSRRFAGRATFVPKIGNTGQNTSFEVWSDRSRFLRHKGLQMVAEPLQRTDAGRFDSTFTVRAGYVAAPRVPLTPGRAVGLVPAAGTGGLLGHVGGATRSINATTRSSATAKGRTTWILRPGLASTRGVSFESADRPGYYLVAPASGSGPLTLVKRSKSRSFAARATFTVSKALTGAGVSLRVTARKAAAVRLRGGGFVVQSVAKTKAGRAAGTFSVRSGLVPVGRK